MSDADVMTVILFGIVSIPLTIFVTMSVTYYD